jgi:hypothetical protein
LFIKEYPPAAIDLLFIIIYETEETLKLLGEMKQNIQKKNKKSEPFLIHHESLYMKGARGDKNESDINTEYIKRKITPYIGYCKGIRTYSDS